MKEIKLGSLCLTKVSKTFDFADGVRFIKKGTYVTVCDIDNNKKYVLVESDGYDVVFDYELSELELLED